MERIFGVVKRRFRLMVAAPEYSLATQTKLIPALCVLHNFIRIYNPDEIIEPAALSRRQPRRSNEDFSRHEISDQEKAVANERRDMIAKDMWRQYQEYLAAGGARETS